VARGRSRLWTVSKKDYREDDNISVKEIVVTSRNLSYSRSLSPGRNPQMVRMKNDYLGTVGFIS
jgi:hypothetical protein